MAKGIQEYSHFGKLLAAYYKVKLQVNYYTSVNPREKNIYSHFKKTVLEYSSSFYLLLPPNIENNPKDFPLVKG